MTKDEVRILMKQLEKVFDIVRLVDVTLTKQVSFTDTNELVEEPYLCYAVWNKGQRCTNCISAKAFASKSRETKFEFIDTDVYHVISMYVDIEGVGYAMEMVTKTDDETLFGAFGQEKLVQTISSYNEKLYIDPLTGAYNRRYYNDQLSKLNQAQAIAMFDVDDFKQINDNCGHQTGDVVLKSIIKIVHSKIRQTDAVVRYGGDEFLILFWNIPKDVFESKLSAICQAVAESTFENVPHAVSISMGGYYCKGDETDIVKQADKLLYSAKAKKNTFHFS